MKNSLPRARVPGCHYSSRPPPVAVNDKVAQGAYPFIPGTPFCDGFIALRAPSLDVPLRSIVLAVGTPVAATNVCMTPTPFARIRMTEENTTKSPVCAKIAISIVVKGARQWGRVKMDFVDL